MKTLLINSLITTMGMAPAPQPEVRLPFPPLIKEKKETTHTINPIELIIKDLNGGSTLLKLGGSEGHGGDYSEMEVINFAWSVVDTLAQDSNISPTLVDVLRDTVIDLKVEIVDDLTLDEIKRKAVNLPHKKTIYLTDEAYHFLTHEQEDYRQRAQFLLHEILPIMGQDDSDYQTSQMLTQNMETKHYGGTHHTVLYSKKFGPQFRGLRFQQARQICDSVKAAYKKEYFAVYCTYQEKYQERYYVDYRYDVFPYRPRRRYHIRGPVYGIRVMGFGLLDHLKEVALIDGYTADMPVYASRTQAIYECGKIVAVQDDTNFKYYRARCEALAVTDGFKFSILTKNPLLQNN